MPNQDRYELRIVQCPELSCGYRVTHRAVADCYVDPKCPKCSGHRLSEFIDDCRPLVVVDQVDRLHGLG